MYLVPLLGTTNANLDYLLRNFCLFTLWAFLKDKSVNSVQNTHSGGVGGGQIMHNTLPQASSDFWTVMMINFQSNKKKEFSSNRNVKKKEFPNKKKEFPIKKKNFLTKKKNLLNILKKKNFLIKKKNFQIKKKEKKKKIISSFPPRDSYN